MPKTFLVSDESINSYRCRVLSEGGDTSAFEANPVMLYMHQRGNVIGKWVNLVNKDGKWYAESVFDVEDTRPGGGAEIGGKVEREFINAASMGIVILEAFYNEGLDCYDITKWSLQEISIVDIGSNQNALQLYNQAGEPLTELQLSAQLEQFKTPKNQSISPQTTMAFELKTMALAFGLPETASEQTVLELAAKGQAAITELTNLKDTVKANLTAEATRLVEEAVTEKRIPATGKDAYLKLFAADHEAAKAVLAGIAKPQNLVNFAQQGAAQTQLVEDSDLAAQYDKMDKAGTLLNLKSGNPDQFKKLYKAKFGKEPDKVFETK